jgi:type IV pilus assembly protein PilQ
MKLGMRPSRDIKLATAFMWSLLVLCWPSLAAAQAAEPSLDKISYSSLPGDRVQIKLDLSAPITDKPLHFTIDNPARIALDFPGTRLNLKEKTQSIGIGMAHSVSAVEAGGRTRVVLNLVRMVGYDIQTQGNSVVVTLETGPGGGPQPAVAGPAPAAPAAGPARIDNIDFRRGTVGEGRIIVILSDPSVGVNINQEAGNIVIDFLDATLPPELDRRLDVIDFATPVKEIDTKPHAGGARMLITTTSPDYDYLAYQSDNILTVEVKPLTPAEKEQLKKEKFGYTGERLSLNFQNIEVRAVLQLLADFTGLNLVASDTVTGSVTLRLKNVPWDQALDIILKSKGLAMRQVGNVIMVAPHEEIAAREKLELESEKQIKELEPLRTEFIQVNYAKADELAGLIKAEANNLLSPRGNISVDQRTNTLIVQDVAASLESIRQMVAKLDIPVRQVLIESRVVNADESFAKDLGIKFGYSRTTNRDQAEGELFGTVGGKLAGDTEFAGTTSFNVDDAENFIVSLPVVAPHAALGLAVGRIGSYLLQLELSAALAEGRGEDIASPKVITANQREALIESGVEIPYQEATSSGATSVSFKKAVLSLRVTPQITPDDRILLDLTVNQDTRGSPDVLGVPPINTRAVSTQVLVDNGETIVLGGIYTQTDRKQIDRVPFFSDLPYFGWLFRRTAVDLAKTELLIFVTPKIIKENLEI